MKKLILAIAATSVLAGCSMTGDKKAASGMNNEDIYVAYVDGRENIFYDEKTYQSFLSHGETAYRKTYIGAGTHGMTRVYGLTKADKKKKTNPAEQMMNGKMQAAEDFYAEVLKEEEKRIYVFSTWNDFDQFVKLGVDNLRYTEIGAGPKGETVVYVLNSSNKKKKPVAQIAKFKAMHGIK